MHSRVGYGERLRREAVLRDIERRVAEDGPRVSRHHPDRARQFMPFAALRGYSELVKGAEDDLARIDQGQLTEEECLEMSETVSSLQRGDRVTVTVFDESAGAYREISGQVDEVVEPLGTMRVNGKWIPFDQIGLLMRCKR